VEVEENKLWGRRKIENKIVKMRRKRRRRKKLRERKK